MTEQYDAIIIGAGHNGLVCSCYLAKAGKKVLVLEANNQVGGAAVTRSFFEDFSVSACAHLLYQLQPQVIKDLNLNPKIISDNITSIVLSDRGEHVRYCGNNVEGVSDSDEKNYREFHKRMSRFARLLNTYFNKPPPRLGAKNKKDLFALAKLGFDLRIMGKKEMREFLRLIGMNIYDELDERFESPLLKGGLSVDAVLGTHLGPRSPNTILTYLYRLSVNQGKLQYPAGGMGSITTALGELAGKAGVEIQTNTAVQRILIENGVTVGVETQAGDSFFSSTIISNVDPKKTIMDLVGPRNVETRFTHRIHHVRNRGNASKIHLALDRLPKIAGLNENDFSARLLIAPNENYVESAFNHAKYGESSVNPILEITFPSVVDQSLAPSGKHVMSAIVQYSPYDLKGGWNESSRDNFIQTIMMTLEKYMPDIKKQVLTSELLTPADIEKEFHISGGHWHHAELSLDQFMFVRPVAGASQYQMPLDGLYLCGAGTHPGGNVNGAAGRNAARMILEQEGSL